MNESKKAIIIGASSGIGKEMALRFAKENWGRNWQVAITGRRKNLLDEIALVSPANIIASTFDADDTDALPARLDELVSRLGGLDLLVISAGCGYLNADMAPKLELQTLRTNVASFTASATWGFNHFKKQGFGQLAAITSVGGLIGEAAAPAYSASKAYQIMYLDSLHKRIKKEKLNCLITELRPGSVDTAMMKDDGHFWISSPKLAAELACQAILKGKRLQYISRRWWMIGFVLRTFSLFS